MKRNPLGWAALVVASAALVSSAGFLRPIPAAPKVPLEGQQAAKALSDAYAAVAEFVRPSVVQIAVQKKASGMRGVPNSRRFQFPPRGNDGVNPRDFEDMLRRFFEPGPEKEQFTPRGAMGVGSGFVYDNHGHIVTNNHVVENAEKIEVTFYDGVKASAKVVGTDNKTDVAVIKVDNTSFPALPKGDSTKLRVGELVMAVGSPFNLSQSVTTGIISALERNNLGIIGDQGYESFIQTDAAINRGNSGGPLVNMNGEVIGINAAIFTGSTGNDGIGFTIPMKIASGVADMLIKDGKVRYARVGIALGSLDAAAARQLGLDENTKGVLVNDVLAGSPAEKAGIKSGDVIVGFDGEKVSEGSSFRYKVATSEPGKPYELVYLRDGKRRTASIVPAPAEKVVFDTEREGKEGEKPAEPVATAKTSIEGFGLEMQPLTPELAKPLELPPALKGLFVSSVKEGGPAEAAGIQEGDVITKIVRDKKIQPVGSVKEFQSAASHADEIMIYVQRGTAGRYLTLSKAAK